MKVFKFTREREYSCNTYLIAANDEEEAKKCFIDDDNELAEYEISLFENLFYEGNASGIIGSYFEGDY